MCWTYGKSQTAQTLTIAIGGNYYPPTDPNGYAGWCWLLPLTLLIPNIFPRDFNEIVTQLLKEYWPVVVFRYSFTKSIFCLFSKLKHRSENWRQIAVNLVVSPFLRFHLYSFLHPNESFSSANSTFSDYISFSVSQAAHSHGVSPNVGLPNIQVYFEVLIYSFFFYI